MLTRVEFQQNIQQLCRESPFWASDSNALKFEQEIKFSLIHLNRDKNTFSFNNEETVLFILIEFSDSYGVPTLAFLLNTLEGARISPENCWHEIFEKLETSFVGNISVEDSKYETKPLRLYKLHPCATPKVMEGLSNAKNMTKSIVNILTGPFQKYDKNIRFL